MSRYQYCLSVVLGHEGGYVDHKNDRGGATNYGVTQKVYSEYLKLIGKPDRPVKEIHESEVEAIYSGYWKDAKCAYMPEPLDLIMFDSAINHGPKRAIKILQRALGVADDGICGKDTLRSVHEEIIAGGVDTLCQLYLNEREAFYGNIIMNDPRQAIFSKGWMARVDHLRSMV